MCFCVFFFKAIVLKIMMRVDQLANVLLGSGCDR